jgi:hypothetical protein
MRYKKPAESGVTASTHISAEVTDLFKQQLSKKGRSISSVDVEIKNHQGMVFL